MTTEGYVLIAVAALIGAAIGVPLGLLVPMTAMPQRIALSHAFGGLAAALVGVAHYYLEHEDFNEFTTAVLGIEIVLGFLVFTGSLMAAGKLQEWLPQRPIVYPGPERGELRGAREWRSRWSSCSWPTRARPGSCPSSRSWRWRSACS